MRSLSASRIGQGDKLAVVSGWDIGARCTRAGGRRESTRLVKAHRSRSVPSDAGAASLAAGIEAAAAVGRCGRAAGTGTKAARTGSGLELTEARLYDPAREACAESSSSSPPMWNKVASRFFLRPPWAASTPAAWAALTDISEGADEPRISISARANA